MLRSPPQDELKVDRFVEEWSSYLVQSNREVGGQLDRQVAVLVVGAFLQSVTVPCLQIVQLPDSTAACAEPDGRPWPASVGTRLP